MEPESLSKLLIEYLIEILYNIKWVSLHVTFFNCCKLKAGSDILAPNILALNGIFISYEVRNYATYKCDKVGIGYSKFFVS